MHTISLKYFHGCLKGAVYLQTETHTRDRTKALDSEKQFKFFQNCLRESKTNLGMMLGIVNLKYNVVGLE